MVQGRVLTVSSVPQDKEIFLLLFLLLSLPTSSLLKTQGREAAAYTVIELCMIVPGAEKILNQCNI